MDEEKQILDIAYELIKLEDLRATGKTEDGIKHERFYKHTMSMNQIVEEVVKRLKRTNKGDN